MTLETKTRDAIIQKLGKWDRFKVEKARATQKYISAKRRVLMVKLLNRAVIAAYYVKKVYRCFRIKVDAKIRIIRF